MRQTAEELAEKLNGKAAGSGWMARCPAHEDRKASLSIAAGDDGRVLLHCHAGCQTADVVAAMGLRLADLMPERANPNGDARPQIVATYDYVDADGRLLYQVRRMRRPSAS